MAKGNVDQRDYKWTKFTSITKQSMLNAPRMWTAAKCWLTRCHGLLDVGLKWYMEKLVRVVLVY